MSMEIKCGVYVIFRSCKFSVCIYALYILQVDNSEYLFDNLRLEKVIIWFKEESSAERKSHDKLCIRIFVIDGDSESLKLRNKVTSYHC